MASFLDVDLKQIAQVIERRRCRPQMPLLLDRGRFGIALGDNQAAERTPMFPGYVLPNWLPLVLAKSNRTAGFCFGQEDAPAILWHLDVAECCPALGFDGNCGSQVNLSSLKAERSELVPPSEEARLPLF